MASQDQTDIKTEAKARLGFSLSGTAQRLLRAMSQKTGLSQTGVVELAIREKAERDNVQ